MKTKLFNSALLAALAMGTASVALAQSSVRLQLEPGSSLSLSGTSTLHGFTCKTDNIQAFIDVDPGYRKDFTAIAKPITSARIEIPAKSLKCGEGKMDNNMYDVLKANDNPTITFILSTYDLADGLTTSNGFTAKTTGKLTIAGHDNTCLLTVKAVRGDDGSIVASGTHSLLLTDFGIKPPRFMFGTLRVGNEIKIQFNLKAGARTVAELGDLVVALR
jgi:Uncharacterized conserved protein